MLYPHFYRATRRLFSGKVSSLNFESLCLENKQLLPAPIVTQRVLEYLEVDHKSVQRVLSAKTPRPLPLKTLSAPQQVQRLTPLVQWSFQKQPSEPHVAGAIFRALEPHINMAQYSLWVMYFQRHFFLSGAPLRSYLLVYKSHLDSLAARSKNISKAENERKKEGKKDSESVENPAGIILTENKEWEWVSERVALFIVKEFLCRGRFAEAIEAYASLPLTDKGRREVVVTVQQFKQYPLLLRLYEVHQEMGGAVRSLDVMPQLEALKRLGRVEELNSHFQQLPPEEQSRAEIQRLFD